MLVYREGEHNNGFHARALLTIGRKTGITLEDRGVYDEHGLEPISGIFSSPDKSPPKRGGNATGSESMELQESKFSKNNKRMALFASNMQRWRADECNRHDPRTCDIPPDSAQ
jgi:centromere protein C